MTHYEEYGKLMIQAEILNGRIQEVKKMIAEELQKPKGKNEKPSDTPSPDAK